MTRRVLEDLLAQNELLALANAACAETTQPEVEEEQDEYEDRARSVVGRKYKQRYKERARAAGIRSKRAKRSAWDWLAQKLAEECLDEKDHLRVPEFLAVLKANEVDYSRWVGARNPGLLRMTGGLALRRAVAETGTLRLPDGEWHEAPAEWLAKYNNA